MMQGDTEVLSLKDLNDISSKQDITLPGDTLLSYRLALETQLAFFKNTTGVLATNLRDSLDCQFFLLSVGVTLTHPTPW